MLELETRPMTWQDVLGDPSLQDLPYKIELDEKGRVLLSQTSRLESFLKVGLGDALRDHAPIGLRFLSAPIQTRLGVRVADAAWMSRERYQNQTQDVLTVAPEICVEILSPSNTAVEMLEKSALYFEAGAVEVWTCDLQGNVKFFAPVGELERSVLVPNFPLLITV
jgi:Uma2 family endonuclease